ncbi:hypothetical protein PGB90_006280 [Kerria lacca]
MILFKIRFIFFTYINFNIWNVNCEFINNCFSLGFNSTALKCSSCDLLPKFNLLSIQEDCLKCCQPADEEIAIKKYAKARLEICTCKFGAFPQIQAFIKSNLPNQYPNLQIRYVHGRDPCIKLINDSGEVEEVIAIEKWNTDSVDEFLRTHLENENFDYLTSNLI